MQLQHGTTTAILLFALQSIVNGEIGTQKKNDERKSFPSSA